MSQNVGEVPPKQTRASKLFNNATLKKKNTQSQSLLKTILFHFLICNKVNSTSHLKNNIASGNLMGFAASDDAAATPPLDSNSHQFNSLLFLFLLPLQEKLLHWPFPTN
ncbi:hypothetical protein L6452_34444 [Arctium lappa]|uniref:Uncharacterized protein n=1 Tax=Arctium lappa TaxID=4217 RepID=A0ACB8YHL0_ARCLA|nr:hypothetical protein L6452_34444 [Arctium lappa]